MPEIEPFQERAKKLVLTLQFVWFVGHLVTAIQGSLCLAFGSPWHYSKAYYGALASYLIILYKAHGFPQLNTQYAQRLLMDENTQYTILSVIWLTGKQLRVTLIPYVVFSVFHALGYVRTELLPKLFPGETLPQSRLITAQLTKFIQAYQARSVDVVARAELWIILPMTLFGIFWGSSFFIPFFYFQFLSFRYFLSPVAKQACHEAKATLDKYIGNNPSLPAGIKVFYQKAIQMVIQYGDIEARARQQQQQQQ
ncbi:hypothetical protein EDD86DRAFT_196362 [Gorgonomyces haynaldii]|nr:hypothetical protein EDD86DRAFT_196362 [Gorgonomyces haynaldii]